MNSEKWLEVIRTRDYIFFMGSEVTTVSLLLAEILRLNSVQRRCYVEKFMTDSNGVIQIDYAFLTKELNRLAEETCNELTNMERKENNTVKKQRIIVARGQLSKENFALLKNSKNTDFMRFLTDLYQII